jgi:hypothetical protein
MYLNVSYVTTIYIHVHVHVAWKTLVINNVGNSLQGLVDLKGQTPQDRSPVVIPHYVCSTSAYSTISKSPLQREQFGISPLTRLPLWLDHFLDS